MNYVLDERGGCWPTRTQELLLKAALLRGNDALEAWKEWISSVEIERLDTGSYRLLPLLYRNLDELGVADPAMKKLKGVYRYTWCKNQVLFHNMASLLKKFHEAGIETMTLKGSALVLLHYRDYGLRPMEDFDVLVPTAKVMGAIEVLKESGWVPVKEFLPDRILPKRHSTPFRCSTQLSLDLHWHVFEERMTNTSDADFWDGSVPVRVIDFDTLALNPTDQMLHAFVHGIRWNAAPPFRWIADVKAILKTSESEIDWDRLLTKAEEHRVILPVREGLAYMRKTFGISVPKGVLESLQGMYVTRKENTLYDVQTRPHNKYGKKRLAYIWVQYRQYLNKEVGDNLSEKLLSFPDFFKKLWRVKRYREIPFYIITAFVRSIFQIINWHMKQRIKDKNGTQRVLGSDN